MRNPKDIAGSKKVPMHLLPASGKIAGAMACREGAIKYGPYNWRERPIELMGYLGAIERHKDAVQDGQDIDVQSLVHHCGHIIATAAIILDAAISGTLVDDRVLPESGKLPAFEAQEEAMRIIEALNARDEEQAKLARMGLAHTTRPTDRLVPRPASMHDDMPKQGQGAVGTGPRHCEAVEEPVENDPEHRLRTAPVVLADGTEHGDSP